MTRISILSMFLFAAVGCGGGDADTGAQVQGVATYRDATTDAGGAPRDPAAPPAQTARVTVTVRGSGTLSGLDATCLDQAAGQFEAAYAGAAQVDADGAYLSAMTAADGALHTPAGCEIPDLAVGAIGEVVIRGELEVTTQNCDAYCAASARADAEAECAAALDRATCWAQTEASAAAACHTECTTQSELIVAETTVSAGALGSLDADALRTASFADLDVDLTFDHLE